MSEKELEKRGFKFSKLLVTFGLPSFSFRYFAECRRGKKKKKTNASNMYSSSLIPALRRDNKHGRILTWHRIEAALEEAKN